MPAQFSLLQQHLRRFAFQKKGCFVNIRCSAYCEHVIGDITEEGLSTGMGLKAVWLGAEQFGNVIGLTKPKEPASRKSGTDQVRVLSLHGVSNSAGASPSTIKYQSLGKLLVSFILTLVVCQHRSRCQGRKQLQPSRETMTAITL